MTATRRRDRLTRAQARRAILGVIAYARQLALARRRDAGGNLGRPHPDHQDRLGEAFLALCEAAQTFEPSRGLAFTTHATFAMRSRFSHYARTRNRTGMTYVAEGVKYPCRPNTDVFADAEHVALAAPATYDPEPDESAEFWRRVRRHIPDRLDYLMLRAVYAHGLTQKQVGEALGISRTRVKQRIERTVERLRARAGEFEGFR